MSPFLKIEVANGAQTQTYVCPNLNHNKCTRRSGKGVDTKWATSDTNIQEAYDLGFEDEHESSEDGDLDQVVEGAVGSSPFDLLGPVSSRDQSRIL